MKLSKSQKKLVSRGLAKGYVTLNDVDELYSCPQYGRQILARLCKLGFFRATESQRYVLARDIESIGLVLAESHGAQLSLQEY